MRNGEGDQAHSASAFDGVAPRAEVFVGLS